MKTGVKVQQGMFLENLWRQMDKLSATNKRTGIAKAASDYLAEGYAENEVVELLVDDGYEPMMAKSCIETVAGETRQGVSTWGFEVESSDQRADIATNADLGLDGVSGDAAAAAIEEAQALVDVEYPGQYTVTRVFRR
jgi:hypothetical protein